MRNLIFSVFVLLLTATFGFTQGLVIDPIVPNSNERIAVDQAIIVVDSSTSMQAWKINEARRVAQLIVGKMPRGDYRTGIVIFGGDRIDASGMQSFNQGALYADVQNIPFIGRDTPLHDSLDQTAAMLSGASGKSAVILISDGVATEPDAAIAAAQALAQGNVCIHTIQISTSEKGADLLQRIANLTNCGSFQAAASITSGPTLIDFVRKVFLETIGVTPVPEPPVIPEPQPEKDSDGDGVPDSRDQCPDTPKGAKVDDRGCWTIREVLFELDKAVIRPQFYGLLDEVADVLKQNPGMNIYIDGHTCDRGTDQYNQQLSIRRANSVRNYLIDQGIEESRLRTRGFGESRPAIPNTSEANRQYNRRVEFSVNNN